MNDPLSRNERMLLADSLNGCYMGLEGQPDYLRMMCGDDGALADARVKGVQASNNEDGVKLVVLEGSVCSGLEHQVYDSIRLDGLAEKWDVDGGVLLAKLMLMTPAQREVLIRGIAGIWKRNDKDFERDLCALEI